MVTDPQSSYAMRLGNLSAWKTASNVGVASAMGMTGAAYVWGRITHDERMRETGVLATEAMLNALGVDYAIKYTTGRLRPYQSNYQNVFFHGGTSFPASHAAVTWAFASIVAHEYPNPLAEFGAYGLALGTSIARAASEQHFLSDVFVGSVMGYQIGRQVYKQRHNKNLDDDLKIVAEQTSAIRPGHFGQHLRSAGQLDLSRAGAADRAGIHQHRFHGPAAVDPNVVRSHDGRDARKGRRHTATCRHRSCNCRSILTRSLPRNWRPWREGRPNPFNWTRSTPACWILPANPSTTAITLDRR